MKDQKLLAVPFDRGCGFCVMKQTTHSEKLNEILNSSQIELRNGECGDLTIKTQKPINISLRQFMNQGKISEKIYQRLKTDKNGTPLRTVLSKPGSSYENLNKLLSSFFDRLPGAIIETNSKDARATLEAIKLDEDELVVSLNVKSLYTNVR